MAEFVSLSNEDRERLLFLIDSSIKINKRFQFFLWAQGTLQSFIPHETLVCATGDLNTLQLRSDVFSRATLPDDFDTLAQDPVHGFVAPMLTLWHAQNRSPVVTGDAEARADALHPMLYRLNYRHNLCHGAREVRGNRGAFFAFLGLEGAAGERERYFADLLMPHLYMATLRMVESEAGHIEGPASVLSEREIQVLGWVRDGKTNAEIGQILDISPLTVKNHVQKILRKLDVSNRAQAVAKATSIGLFVNGHVGESSLS
ncbi:helix-turn-helix transcriptional regulator [Nitrogeniibacter mangrovi]|uniref:Helix-turn-helix transcriptional regulator n=1 Tax=Nitrogeniibacter mangrovi TaxID=2016596 RepID=A0A6C1AXY1_9RHOO|nr:XrtB/PEP-CTERM-associated transcriptional regulator EpsA [Nitrogeniibacter mangrovi]QID16206.1 helix-turn-helix transcriptional regulator [Nitrogeniibacter mangrovi]